MRVNQLFVVETGVGSFATWACCEKVQSASPMVGTVLAQNSFNIWLQTVGVDRCPGQYPQHKKSVVAIKTVCKHSHKMKPRKNKTKLTESSEMRRKTCCRNSHKIRRHPGPCAGCVQLAAPSRLGTGPRLEGQPSPTLLCLSVCLFLCNFRI